jgi:hypothetical protein
MSSPLEEGGREVLSWRVHLAAAAPGKAAAVVLAIALAAGLAALLWPGPLFPLAVAFVLLSAVAEFLFPIHYRLTPVGAEMRCFLARRVIRWSTVRRIYSLSEGIKLSPLDRPGRREAFRGLFLRFAGNEAEVRCWVWGIGCWVLGVGCWETDRGRHGGGRERVG